MARHPSLMFIVSKTTVPELNQLRTVQRILIVEDTPEIAEAATIQAGTLDRRGRTSKGTPGAPGRHRDPWTGLGGDGRRSARALLITDRHLTGTRGGWPLQRLPPFFFPGCGF